MDTIQITDVAGARRLTAVVNPAEAEVRGSDFLIALDSFGPITPTEGDLATGAAPPAEQEDDEVHDMSASDLGEWLPPATAPATFFQSVAKMDIVGHQSDTAPAASANDPGYLLTVRR